MGDTHSAWASIVRKAFPGNQRIRGGKPQCIVKADTGAIDTAAPVGTLGWNSADGDAYICTVATGTWVKINA